MKRILILVEGLTEERFVKDVLYPYFLTKNICLIPKILTTKEVKDGANFKGGIRSFVIVKKHILRLLEDTNAVKITTMFDYYGLSPDFPGITNNSIIDCQEKIVFLEDEFNKVINNKRFFSYFQLHEFEALLFSSPEIIGDAMISTQELTDKVISISGQFKNPEYINNHPETCPSKRLIKIYPYYNKVIYGTLISTRIGLETLRKSCPHFNKWIELIES